MLQRADLEKPPVAKLVKTFHAFYETRSSLLCSDTRHWSLSLARLIQSTSSHPVCIQSTSTRIFHLRLGLPSDPFPSGFPTKIWYVYLISRTCYMPRPSHPPWLHHHNNVWWNVQIINLRQFFPSSCYFLWGPNILLSWARDWVSNPYQTTGKALVLCILIFTCRSQWSRGLRHEMSSPAQTLGSWVRITLEAWMSVRVSSVFVLSCVCSSLATGWSPVQGVLPTVYKIHNFRITWLPMGTGQRA
jgi:hypothetical protein